jgi:hypothetical protein
MASKRNAVKKTYPSPFAQTLIQSEVASGMAQVDTNETFGLAAIPKTAHHLGGYDAA